MYKESGFKLKDLIVVIACILLVAFTFVLPARTSSVGRSRAAVCRNNMKLIGVGLELWHQNAGYYPAPDIDIDDVYTTLDSWPDMLALNPPFDDRELLEEYFETHTYYDIDADDFIKVVEDDKIFMCPADHPHPHRINEARSRAWGFNPYEYSYSISMEASSGEYDPSADKQVLSADGVWDWSQNFSAAWINDPQATYDTGGWWCNTVGYWHKRKKANFLLRDLHIESHKYPPDTNEIFFWEPGEPLDVYH